MSKIGYEVSKIEPVLEGSGESTFQVAFNITLNVRIGENNYKRKLCTNRMNIPMSEFDNFWEPYNNDYQKFRVKSKY